MSAQTLLLWLALICFIVAAILSVNPPSNPRINAAFFVAVGLAFWVATALIH